VDIGLFYISIAFALGGILKGATGAGAPIIAIPLIALYYSVPVAVAVFVVPNFVSNSLQIWKFRTHIISYKFIARFAGAGIVGVGIGTVILAYLPSDILKLAVAVAMLIYIIFRLLHPDWKLAFSRALKIAVPIGFLAGILQGASGISAPVSITFLNSMRLDRPQFILTVSIFFISMLLVQIPMLSSFGFLTVERLLIGCAATAILLIFMPVGTFLSKFASKEVFDRAILILLALLALRLFLDVWP